MGQIYIQEIKGPAIADYDVEIVERKGLGHPDTICDSVMERISQALSQAYLRHYGRILHHNCDKGLLVAGKVERRLGGGNVLEPMRLVIGDRATLVQAFDVAEIAVDSAQSWFRENLPHVDPVRHFTYQVELKGGSDELTGIFNSGETILSSNDTSAAVGYAPLTETERIVLDAERFVNGREFKTQYPASGTDVKVMGVRRGTSVNLTVAMPLLDQYVDSERSYFRQKQEMAEALVAHLQSRVSTVEHVAVDLNTLDRPGTGLAGMYLTVLGTSAEDADSGEVGRGNQVNGIIALNRPRGSEAAAGKNPVSHVGKIYNVFTHQLAHQLHAEISGLQQVLVWLCSRIGDPVNEPQMASVQVQLSRGIILGDVVEPIRQLITREFSRIPVFCEELAHGKYPIC